MLVVSDRTVLDDQLQEAIFDFERTSKVSATEGLWIDGDKIKVADVRITDGLHTTPTDPNHTIVDRRGLFVIHAVLLHTGKVLWFCGHVEHGHYALKSYLFDYRNPAAQLASQDFVLHNPSQARGAHAPNNPATGDFHADLFCSHFVHTHDGKVLVVGGSDPDFHIPGATGHGSVGETYIHTFDPTTETWNIAMNGATPSRLRQGRWYPTAVMLGDGRVAVFSGRLQFPTGNAAMAPAARRTTVAQTVEILTPPTYAATTLTVAVDQYLPIYPGLHLAPNGRIYYTHTTWGLEFDPPTDTLSIAIPNGATSANWTVHAGVNPPRGAGSPAGVPRREEGMSVLLPPAQDGKILLIGGGEALGAGGRVRNGNDYTHVRHAADARSTAILNTSGANPVWTAGPMLAHARINGHAVILPDKKVLICGGHNSHKWNAVNPGSPPDPALANNAQSFVSELYDPATNTLAPAASLNHARMYHAAAVLLPDGTVLIAGGADADPDKLGAANIVNEYTIHNGLPDDFSYPGLAPNPIVALPNRWQGPLAFWEDLANPSGISSIPYNRKDYEIYRPPYLFTPGTQPSIDSITRNGAATTRADYGDTLRIRSSQAATGTEAALIRPGAATHHTDSEQRYVALAVSNVSGNELTVTIPNDRNLVPPGYYMFWIIKAGKPCAEAKFILVGSYLAPSPPAAPSSSWCLVVTAAMGSVNAPEVVFLQGLRRDLNHSGDAGRRFIRAVNALYYSVSPQIARRMRSDRGLRTAIRDIAVLPAVSLTDKARRVCGYASGPHRSAALVALLTAMGLAGLALSPLLALLILARWTREALRQPRESEHE